MPTLREYEQALQRDPAQTEAFLALRKAYRETGKLDKLVTLYECRGQAIEDKAKAADLFYLAAEVRIDHLNDAAGAAVDLAHAVDKNPGHLKATKRLKDIFRTQGRTSEYMTMLEMEAVAATRSKDAALAAGLATEMGHMQTQHLARIERALTNPASRNEVSAEDIKLVESARKIYRALADWPAVVRLYDVELAAVADPKRRAELLLGLGRVLGEKQGDLAGAAQRIGEVVRLRPRDDKALEALANVYAHPKWTAADGPDRAASLYVQVARRRQEAGDLDSALAVLRKALTARPGHAESSDLLERILYDGNRLQDLDRYYRERVASARTNEEKMDFLFKRAQLAQGDLGDAAESLRIYEEIVSIEPPGGPASQHLAQLYQTSQDFAKLAELREKQLEIASDAGYRKSLLVELASLYRDRLGDREQGAVYLHAILQMDPGNREALQAYADHFRQRGDWKDLADLLDFAVEHAQSGGAQPKDLVPRLEEIAAICEGKLADNDRALVVWERINALMPGYERARESQKRILQKAKQWDKMADVLEREAQSRDDPAQKVEILRRLARMCVEKLNASERAAGVYLQILALDPRDLVALRALVDTYEKGEKWGELATLLRQQMELAASKQEKLTLLRRLLTIYDERLKDTTEGAWAAAEILKLIPGERDAVTRLEAMLERTGDVDRLVQTLEYHIRYAGTADEKVRLVRRLAELLHNQVGDLERAAACWEQLIRLAPGDGAALVALATAYEKLKRPEDLVRILDLQIQRSTGDIAVQTEAYRRLARVAATGLHQPARAQRAWEELARLVPTDREALEQLATIFRNKGEWKALAAILERRVPLAEDPSAGMALALERAVVLEENLGDSEGAIRALEQIITELDPRSVEAHDRLRRVAEAKGDWDRVVNVAERRLTLVEDPADRVARALEIGRIWRDRLRDTKRALAAFEHVIEIDSENVEALRALAPLYAEAGDGQRLIFTDDRLLQHTEDPDERRRLMFEIADTHEKTLREPRMAFEWYRRAYQEGQDEAALQRLEGVAEAHGLWEDLIAVYAGERARSSDPADRVEVALKVASLCEERLKSPARAFVILRDALPSDPAGEMLLLDLERLAETTKDWKGLLDVYAQVARGRPTAEERVELLRRRAAVREEHLGDPSGAMDELLRSFALNSDSEETQREILRLAELTGRWEDALAMQGQLFARADGTNDKVDVARRAAALVEEKVKDRVRAFRAYLNAFRLAPEDEGIVANLWRLAELIDRYVPKATPAASEASDTESSTEHEVEFDEIQELTPAPIVTGPPSLPPKLPTPSARPMPRPSPYETPWEELAGAYEFLPAADQETRHRFLMRIADVWERGAKDTDRALRALERVFRLETGNEEVRSNLRRLAASANRWDDVCEIYLRAVEGASRDEAVALHREVARYRTELGQHELAEERYQAIAMLSPEDTAALGQLEQMYRSQERWVDLAGILEKRTSGGAESLPPGSERRTKTLELAVLQEKRLERPYEAIDTLEKYVASIDEDQRGYDNKEVIREACEAYESLVRLYSKVGMWPKAVSALQHESELYADVRQVRQIRGRIAEIYERELGQIDHAIQAYEAILASAPDDEEALAALERLHEAHGRWEPLQEVLGRRADLAAGAARTELIRRRAKIHEERLGNPDAAASCLRELGSDGVSDEEVAEALLRNLRSAGLGHEALRVLCQRIDLLTAKKSSPKKLVALHLEVAGLKAQQLGDTTGARESVEAALAIGPNDPAALATLAKLHLKDNDFASYAQTCLRQARVSSGTAEGAQALLEAGAVCRDQLNDPALARTCFERAVDEYPENPAALHALAALLASEGQLAEARVLYERQLALVDTPVAKAEVLTDLARALWEKPGDAPDATVRLDEALELAPDHLPAVLTMADIYYREQQWVEAERRLNQALRRLRNQPAQAATLYLRLAEVHEKLGRVDDAYKQLGEADRLAPGQLLVRISLGENRFQARKWREGATHLEGIADHPDAAVYPDEVAQALAHGAQAETKLKRPERAVAMYEAALRFRPDHRPSLSALADMALERGDTREAAQYLSRVAAATTERAERAQLYEKLGDLYDGLDETEEARNAYQAAVDSLERAEEKHIALLGKTLALQRAVGAVREASETALRITELVSDAKERATRRRDVAALLAEQGDFARAAEILEKAIGDNPEDEDVLALLCVAYERGGRTDSIQDALSRLLPLLPPISGKRGAATRRADLWERLGGLLKKRNPQESIMALEMTAALDPDRVSAREALAQLYGKPSESEAALKNARALVHADVTRAEALRGLAAAYAKQGRIDWARCCYEVLDLLGMAKKGDRKFLVAHPAPTLKPEDPYSGALEESDRVRFLAHPEARSLAEVFATIYEGVPGLSTTTLDSLNVSVQDKVSPISEQDLGKVYGQTSKALGNKKTNLYINWDPGYDDVIIVMAPPSAIVVGGRLATGTDVVEMRFRLGRALELARPEYILAASVPPKDFTQLFAGVLKAFHPRHARWRAGTQGAEQAAKVKKALPYKAAKRLAELFQQNDQIPFSSVRWRTVVQETGSRAGLLMCGDLKAAAGIVLRESVEGPISNIDANVLREHAAKPGPLRELLRYAVSEEYFTLRESLGTNARKSIAA